MEISEDIKFFIKYKALNRPEQEICGLLCFNDIFGVYPVECNNDAPDKKNYFLISEKQIENLSLDDKIIGFYHSHLTDDHISKYDRFVAEKKNLECLMYSIIRDDFEIYKPSGLKIPLVGRPHICGLFDCWNLVEDYYKDNLNIKLHNFDLNTHILMDEQTISFEEKKQKCEILLFEMGFQKVNDLRDGDVLILKFLPDKNCAIHFGIFLSPNKILHHGGIESVIESYRDGFKNRTKSIFRHKQML